MNNKFLLLIIVLMVLLGLIMPGTPRNYPINPPGPTDPVSLMGSVEPPVVSKPIKCVSKCIGNPQCPNDGGCYTKIYNPCLNNKYCNKYQALIPPLLPYETN